MPPAAISSKGTVEAVEGLYKVFYTHEDGQRYELGLFGTAEEGHRVCDVLTIKETVDGGGQLSLLNLHYPMTRYGIDDETAEEIACVTFQQVVRDLMVCAVQPLHPLEVTVLTTWERSTAGGTGYMTLNAEDDTGGISHNTGAVSSEEDDGAAPQAGAQDAKSHMLDNEAAKSPSRAQRMLHQAASEHALRSAGLASFGGKRVAEQVSAAQLAGEESHRETLRKERPRNDRSLNEEPPLSARKRPAPQRTGSEGDGGAEEAGSGSQHRLRLSRAIVKKVHPVNKNKFRPALIVKVDEATKSIVRKKGLAQVMLNVGNFENKAEAALVADYLLAWRQRRYGLNLETADYNYEVDDVLADTSLISNLGACTTVLAAQEFIRALVEDGTIRRRADSNADMLHLNSKKKRKVDGQLLEASPAAAAAAPAAVAPAAAAPAAAAPAAAAPAAAAPAAAAPAAAAPAAAAPAAAAPAAAAPAAAALVASPVAMSEGAAQQNPAPGPVAPKVEGQFFQLDAGRWHGKVLLGLDAAERPAADGQAAAIVLPACGTQEEAAASADVGVLWALMKANKPLEGAHYHCGLSSYSSNDALLERLRACQCAEDLQQLIAKLRDESVLATVAGVAPAAAMAMAMDDQEDEHTADKTSPGSGTALLQIDRAHQFHGISGIEGGMYASLILKLDKFGAPSTYGRTEHHINLVTCSSNVEAAICWDLGNMWRAIQYGKRPEVMVNCTEPTRRYNLPYTLYSGLISQIRRCTTSQDLRVLLAEKRDSGKLAALAMKWHSTMDTDERSVQEEEGARATHVALERLADPVAPAVAPEHVVSASKTSREYHGIMVNRNNGMCRAFLFVMKSAIAPEFKRFWESKPVKTNVQIVGFAERSLAAAAHDILNIWGGIQTGKPLGHGTCTNFPLEVYTDLMPRIRACKLAEDIRALAHGLRDSGDLMGIVRAGKGGRRGVLQPEAAQHPEVAQQPEVAEQPEASQQHKEEAEEEEAEEGSEARMDGCSILPGGTHVEDGLQLSADAVHEPVQEPSTPDEPAAPILAAAAPNLQHAIIAPDDTWYAPGEAARISTLEAAYNWMEATLQSCAGLSEAERIGFMASFLHLRDSRRFQFHKIKQLFEAGKHDMICEHVKAALRTLGVAAGPQ